MNPYLSDSQILHLHNLILFQRKFCVGMYVFLFLLANILGSQSTLKNVLLTEKWRPLLYDTDFSDKYPNL